MSSYLLLHFIHVTCVVLSISFFVVRGVWMMADSDLLSRRVVRIAPHVIDTVLLVSAILLAVLIGQYPFVDGWLTIKVLALVLYIGLGMVALRLGRTKRIRIVAFVLAVLTFAFIVSVAVAHHPAGLFHDF